MELTVSTTCYMKDQWCEFRVKNATSCLHMSPSHTISPKKVFKKYTQQKVYSQLSKIFLMPYLF